MKLTQEEPEFKPITITLETKEEVVAFWDVIISAECKSKEALIERCAAICDKYADDPVYCGNAIRELKGDKNNKTGNSSN